VVGNTVLPFNPATYIEVSVIIVSPVISVIVSSDVNIEFFVNPDIESWNPIKIRISVHSGA